MNWKKQNWWRILLIVILALGVCLRFVNLDRKVYWNDEVFTSLRISGYTETEFIQQTFNGREIGIEDLQKFQRPNAEKGISGTIEGLATEEPQHPPLYFILARFWVQQFGNSVAVTRSLSALISLFVFPCIYWLCIELFQSSLTGWVAIALVAVSPFHVVYAQEARQYSLWTVAILLSSALLLRSLRLNTKRNWGMYGLSVAFGLYTFPFSAFVALSHGIYLAVIEKLKLNQKTIGYLIATTSGFFAFMPWLIIMAINLRAVKDTTSSSTIGTSFLSLVKQWARNIKIVFVTIDISWYLTPLILILVAYALYFLWRTTPKQVWLFIFSLILVMALALILPDLILGGQRSGAVNARYFIPCYLGMELAVAHLLATGIVSLRALQQQFWRAIATVLVSAGVISCAIAAPSETSLSKIAGNYNPEIARIVNRYSRPLVISDTSNKGNPGDLISLSYLLKPNVRFQLVMNPRQLQIIDPSRNVFLFNPAEGWQDIFKQPKYEMKPIFTSEGRKLWQLQEKSENS